MAASLFIISAARDPAVVERVTRAAVTGRDGTPTAFTLNKPRVFSTEKVVQVLCLCMFGNPFVDH